MELHHLDSYRLHVRSQLRDLENREGGCEAQVVAQRQRVLEARRLFELLDRLRNKALAEWRAIKSTRIWRRSYTWRNPSATFNAG
jgi:hypothetical protein